MTLEDVPEMNMSRYVIKLNLNIQVKNEILKMLEVLDCSITHVTSEAICHCSAGII
jgi:predicted transcriptional regulator